MDEDEPELSVGEFVEYCRTQAGLLSGSVATMAAEADELLDDIDEETAAIRQRLEGRTDDVEGPVTPSPNDRDGTEIDVAELEELEADVEEKQTLVEAKQARIAAFQELAAGYTDLVEELRSDADDGREAMKRVVRFESQHDAPAYFDDRRTVYEAAASSDTDSP
ncbi:hypothetical protein [Haladaptatus salinisoli]|uniref:hypothetical protein n=1 Tax=Haladaptatus salinisoli TaxID=2884876 RepID=UPI001D0B8EBB|nr:hypothetical protein [Haladaptatus salinisoli]